MQNFIEKRDLLFLERILEFHKDERRIKYVINNYERVKFDVLKVTRYLKEGSKILNIGSDPFIFEDLLSEVEHINIDSLDCSTDWAKLYCKERGHNLLVCDIEEPQSRQKIQLRNYDIIIMTELFEHLRIDIIGLFKYLYENSSKGTLVYLTTPNFLTLEKIIFSLTKFRSGPIPLNQWLKLGKFGHMGHIREYTMPEVDEILEYVGFKKINSGYRNINHKNKKKLINKLIYLFHKILVKIFPRFSEDFFCIYQKI